jgi:hypothetical protein
VWAGDELVQPYIAAAAVNVVSLNITSACDTPSAKDLNVSRELTDGFGSTVSEPSFVLKPAANESILFTLPSKKLWSGASFNTAPSMEGPQLKESLGPPDVVKFESIAARIMSEADTAFMQLIFSPVFDEAHPKILANSFVMSAATVAEFVPGAPL